MSARSTTEEDSEPRPFLEVDQLLKLLGQLTYRRRHIREFPILFRLVQRLLKLVCQGVRIHREVLDEELLRQGILLQDL